MVNIEFWLPPPQKKRKKRKRKSKQKNSKTAIDNCAERSSLQCFRLRFLLICTRVLYSTVVHVVLCMARTVLYVSRTHTHLVMLSYISYSVATVAPLYIYTTMYHVCTRDWVFERTCGIPRARCVGCGQVPRWPFPAPRQTESRLVRPTPLPGDAHAKVRVLGLAG